MLGFPGMEKAMASHSSSLAWKIPWMEEPGRLQSMVMYGCESWTVKKAECQRIHAFELFGESQAQGSLVGCHLCGRTESDTTEVT